MRTAAAVLLVAAVACRLPAQPRPTAEEGQWNAVRERSSRSGKLYDGLATNAFVRTVYLSRGVREAWVARVATWKVLSVAETEKLLATEHDEAASFEDFQIDLFTAEPSDNDLDAAHSIWRVALVVPGEPDRLPLGVEQVRPDATLRNLYPGIGDFDTVYRVRFQRTAPLEGKPFVLRLAGGRGRLDLQY